MNTERKWGHWIEHKSGDPCPIPDVKAGEYEVKRPDGSIHRYISLSGKDVWEWGDVNFGTTHYRLLEPEPDWKAIAERRRNALDTIIGLLGNIDYSKGGGINTARLFGVVLEKIRQTANEAAK